MAAGAYRLKLASFNLQNLGRADSSSEAAYESKLCFLADVLARIDADLAVVNEVREPECFGELADMLPQYNARHIGERAHEHRNLQTGMLSRLPVLELGQWLGYQTVVPGDMRRVDARFRRAVPWMKVTLPNGETLLAVAVHLKSRRPDVDEIEPGDSNRTRHVLGQALSCSLRVSEAAGLRLLLDRAMENRAADHFAVMGDFNDGPDSAAVDVVCSADSGETGDADGVAGLGLAPAGSWIPAERRYSFERRGRRELLDQILVSSRLSLGFVAAGAAGELLVPERLQDDRDSGYSRSDHAPVWATFELVSRVRDLEWRTG